MAAAVVLTMEVARALVEVPGLVVDREGQEASGADQVVAQAIVADLVARADQVGLEVPVEAAPVVLAAVEAPSEQVDQAAAVVLPDPVGLWVLEDPVEVLPDLVDRWVSEVPVEVLDPVEVLPDLVDQWVSEDPVEVHLGPVGRWVSEDLVEVPSGLEGPWVAEAQAAVEDLVARMCTTAVLQVLHSAILTTRRSRICRLSFIRN